MNPVKWVIGGIVADAGRADGRLPVSLAASYPSSALSRRKGDRDANMDRRMDDDIVAYGIGYGYLENAKRIRTTQEPGAKSKLTPAQTNSGLAPAVCAFCGYAANDGCLVAGYGGFVDDLHPNGGKTALILNFELFAKAIANGDPTKTKTSSGVESPGKAVDPEISNNDQTTEANEQGIPDPAGKEDGRR